jgi:hypothetical protein
MESLDLNKYPNGGMRTEKTIFHKKFIAGTLKDYDSKGNKIPMNFNIEVTIKEINLASEVIFCYKDGVKTLSKVGNTKQTTNLITVNKYKTLSICGSYRHGVGQCQNLLTDKDFKPIHKFNNKRFKEIWNTHHLNDLQSGTQKQQEVLNSWKERPNGWSYSEDCEYLKEKKLYSDRGYKFGSAWLIQELPLEIEEEIKQLISNIK